MNNEHSGGPGPGPALSTKVLSLLLLLLASVLIWMVLKQSDAPAMEAVFEPRVISPSGNLAESETTTIDLFKNVSPSVVHITSVLQQRSRFRRDVTNIPQGTGSGFMWDTNGHIVTNYHVIQNANAGEVTLEDKTVYRTKIIGISPIYDLAVLKITAPKSKMKPIPLGTSDDLQVGQGVFAIGNPFDFDQTLTTGIISALGREIKSPSGRNIYGVIQTDASINPGNSGGPLLDSSSRLIGVNTAIASPTGAYAGIGFAIPVDTVRRVVPELIKNGRMLRPGLGINHYPKAQRFGLKGVLISHVVKGGAADKAGLQGIHRSPRGQWLAGDVIVGLDNIVVDDINDLLRALDQKRIGETVKVTVENNRKKRVIPLALQAIE